MTITEQRVEQLQDEAVVRRAIRQDLGTEAFTPRPGRYMWFAIQQLVFWGATAINVLARPSAAIAVALAVVAGLAITSQAFLAHEALHGALGGPKWLRLTAGWLGFGPELIAPSFWVRWHNLAHHGNTNMGDKDPDNFGTTRRYEKAPRLARFVKLAPGSGTWYSYLFLLYSFTFHAQVVLLIQGKHRSEFKGMPRGRYMAQAVMCTIPWIAIGYASGLYAFATVAIPFMMVNAIGQSFILTNHFMRPMTPTNNPVDNSMSVKSWKLTDKVFFNFSHHVEHHLFPRMSSTTAPAVRQWLTENMPERYVCPGHLRSVAMLYKTPRVYKDAHTLSFPDGSNEMSIEEVQSRLVGV